MDITSVTMGKSCMADDSRLERNPGLDSMSSFDNNTKCRPSTTTKGEEEVLVLALVGGAVDAIRGHNLDLDLQ